MECFVKLKKKYQIFETVPKPNRSTVERDKNEFVFWYHPKKWDDS